MPAGDELGHPQRGLVGLGAGRQQQHLAQRVRQRLRRAAATARRPGGESMPLNRWSSVPAGLAHGRDDRRVRVAEDRAHLARREVEQLAAVARVERCCPRRARRSPAPRSGCSGRRGGRRRTRTPGPARSRQARSWSEASSADREGPATFSALAVQFCFTMLDPRRLRLLIQLESLGTVRAVAQAASMSPSAVSQQLAALERESGTALLERHGRSVALTDAGVALAGHARVILERIDAAEEALRALRGRARGHGARLRLHQRDARVRDRRRGARSPARIPASRPARGARARRERAGARARRGGPRDRRRLRRRLAPVHAAPALGPAHPRRAARRAPAGHAVLRRPGRPARQRLAARRHRAGACT